MSSVRFSVCTLMNRDGEDYIVCGGYSQDANEAMGKFCDKVEKERTNGSVYSCDVSDIRWRAKIGFITGSGLSPWSAWENASERYVALLKGDDLFAVSLEEFAGIFLIDRETNYFNPAFCLSH